MRRIAERIMLLDGWRRALLAVLAGAIATFGLAPYHFLAAGFVSFPVLVWLLDGAAGEPGAGRLRRLLPAFAVGWCFGFGYFVGGLWWLGAAMLVDADAFLWALPLAVLGLPAVLAVYHGLAAMLARALWSDGAGRILSLAASLTLFEVLRGWLFTGFPWNEIGMLAAPLPLLMQSVSLAGLHVLTLAAIVVFATPALIVGNSSLRPTMLALSAALVVAHVGFGAWRLSSIDGATVPGVDLRIVQPNILQAQKWEPEEAERIFSKLIALSAPALPGDPASASTAGENGAAGDESGAPGQTLVVWPETAFPFILTQRPQAIARLADMLGPGETLLAGATRMEEAGATRRFYNSVLAIAEDGTIAAGRDKLHLVPFGEYLPFQGALESLGIRQLAELPGGFSAGATRAPLELAGGLSATALICYEIIFQDELEFEGAEERPGFILNVTNDAWYGTTPGPYQHLAHSQMSAVAFGLPLVRAANSGISVVADRAGRRLGSLPLASEGTLRTALPEGGPPTPFARYGNWPFALLLGAAFVGAGAGVRLGRRND